MTYDEALQLLPHSCSTFLVTSHEPTVVGLREAVRFELRACNMGDNPLSQRQINDLHQFLRETVWK